MRIYEFAKEINVQNNDILDVLKKIDADKKYTASSGIKDEDIPRIKKGLAQAGKYSDGAASGSANKQQEQAAAKPAQQAANQDARPSRDAARDNDRQGQGGAQPQGNAGQARQAQNNGQGQDGRKPHITQVFNPQNSERNRDNRGNNRQGGFNGNGGNRDNRQGGFNGNGGNRDNRQGGFNGNGGNRDNRQGGFNGNGGNRDNRQGGFNGGNRDNRQGGFNGNGGNRDNRQGGFNGNGGNRDNRQGGFNGNGGNRDNRQGGFNGGNRDNRQGGFNGGNRDNRQGGFNGNGGNRDNRQGGFNGGNRDNRQGGFGGNRGNGQGGFGGNRGNGQGGFGGNRGNGQGSFGGRRDDFRRDGGSEKFDFEQKDSRRADNRRNDYDHKEQKDSESRENQKFANQKKNVVKQHEKEEVIKNLVLPDKITIKELADKMKVQPSVVVKKLFLQGKVVTINEEVDYDTAEEIALEFNCLCEHEKKVDLIAELLKEEEEDESTMVTRPPVVCVMGHVDHGKTSLLDAIRSTNVTSKESGGITQKIGAYTVEINGQKITFLDTPGHEAFTAMRMRGAQSTDIAILVVAADDGVMPQTIEAINHAKAAGIDIIVAINKIDKPNANIDRVKQELTEYELVAEDWGGSTIFCPVSAHTKEGIDNLLEMILLDAEVLELKANPKRKARGLVIEALLDKGRGPVANILVQKGTLRVGDTVAAGSCYGKIRAMTDDKGNRVKEAGPSTPVEVLGLNDVPNAGEILVATENDKEARNFADTFIRAGREKLLDDTKSRMSLDDLFSQIQAGNVKELNIIVKADVQGSVEAVKSSLLKLSNDEVVVKIIHGGVGNINESDVSLASASNAIIIGFNVKPDNQAQAVADHEKVDIRLYKVIYNAIEDVEAALKGMLEPKYEEKVTGHIVVRQLYKASAIGVIAGSYVTDGYVTKNASVRLSRGDEVLYDGPLASLKRFKDDVKEVKEGYECGIVLEKFNNIQEDDVMEAYEMVEVPR
jgi:translation initiation factor IF-2